MDFKNHKVKERFNEVGLNIWSDREWIKQNLEFEEEICIFVLAGLQGGFGESLHVSKTQ